MCLICQLRAKTEVVSVSMSERFGDIHGSERVSFPGWWAVSELPLAAVSKQLSSETSPRCSNATCTSSFESPHSPLSSQVPTLHLQLIPFFEYCSRNHFSTPRSFDLCNSSIALNSRHNQQLWIAPISLRSSQRHPVFLLKPQSASARTTRASPPRYLQERVSRSCYTVRRSSAGRTSRATRSYGSVNLRSSMAQRLFEEACLSFSQYVCPYEFIISHEM